jgi:hypothetical protein
MMNLSQVAGLRRLRAMATIAFAVASLAGCKGLLDVKAPSRVLAEDLADPSFAGLLAKSAQGDFNCAFSSYLETALQVTDELMGVHIISAEAMDYDRRAVNPARFQYATYECGQYGAIYQPIETAVWQADNALKVLESLTDAQVAGRLALIQQTQAYAGYGRILLGEGFCTAVINMGAEMTSDQVFAEAEALFTKALTGPAAEYTNMARMGRARTRFDLKNNVGALADAQLVPVGYVKNAEYSSAASRAYNGIYTRNINQQSLSVEAGFRNLTFKGVPDPRVKTAFSGQIGSDGRNPVWSQFKYTAFGSPIPVARYAEAQLIIAEIQGGQTAVNIINTLHRAVGLPDFASTNETEIKNQVYEERARELFLEGQRFWDFRRLNLPFVPPVGTNYLDKGGTYGSTRCFPLPDLERNNNPNLAKK